MSWPVWMRARHVSGVMALLRATLAALAVYLSVRVRMPPQGHVPDQATYDFVIVGAGTAGCVLAHRLSEAPGVRVLLVEAGSDPPAESLLPGLYSYIPGSRVDWNYQTVDDKYSSQAHKTKNIQLTRGKMLGGSSSANLMLHVRGNPADFDGWAAAGNPGWGWDTALKYFIKSESLRDPEIMNSEFRKFHSDKGPMGVTRVSNKNQTQIYFDAFQELGYEILLDANSDRQLVFSEGQYIFADGLRQSTAVAYLAPVAHRKDLHVLKNTLVTKVLFDKTNKAIGVEALTETGEKKTIKARKEVILSAGAINTPQILMLSGIGPKEHLDKFNICVIADLPVGQNLHDHITAPLYLTVGRAAPPAAPPATPPAAQPAAPPDLGVYDTPTITGYVALNKSQPLPSYQVTAYTIGAGSRDPLVYCVTFYGLEDAICDTIDRAAQNNDILFTEINLMHPESRGYVHLRSRDPKDPPIIYLGYYSNDHDLEVHARSIEDYLRVLNTTNLKRMNSEVVDLKLPGCKGIKFGSHEYWRCYAREIACTVWHPVGTAALGAVLDARLRVRRVRGLRVADASAMPRITSGNTNAPVAMIAEHAADIIKRDYGIATEF